MQAYNGVKLQLFKNREAKEKYEDDDYYDEDDGPLPSTIDCPNCTGKAKWDGEFYRCKRCGFCGDSSFG